MQLLALITIASVGYERIFRDVFKFHITVCPSLMHLDEMIGYDEWICDTGLKSIAEQNSVSALNLS